MNELVDRGSWRPLFWCRRFVGVPARCCHFHVAVDFRQEWADSEPSGCTQDVFSADLESGLYRYISYNKLLEVEAGITSNEPPQMAVMESIESCVYALIMEGLISHAWSLANPAGVQPLIEQYLKDRDSKMVAQFDSHGNVVSVVPDPK